MRAVESWERPGKHKSGDLTDIDVKPLKKMTEKKSLQDKRQKYLMKQKLSQECVNDLFNLRVLVIFITFRVKRKFICCIQKKHLMEFKRHCWGCGPPRRS